MPQLMELSGAQAPASQEKSQPHSLRNSAAIVGPLVAAMSIAVLAFVMLTESRLTPVQRAHIFETFAIYP
jgi:hypothetical protein